MPDPIAQIPALPLQQGKPRLQNSAVNTPPPISALLLQRYVLPLQPSAIRDAPTLPPLSLSIQGRGGSPPPNSAVRAHAPLFSALLPQQVEPPLQPSAVSHPPLPKILDFPLQKDVPPVQSLSAWDPPPPLSLLLQGRGKASLLPSNLRAYVLLISSLLIWKCVRLCQSLARLLLFLIFQPCLFNEAVPPLQPIAMCALRPPPIYVSLQGIGVPQLLPSAVRTYAHLLW